MYLFSDSSDSCETTVWNLDTGRRVQSDRVTSAKQRAVSPDGRWLVTFFLYNDDNLSLVDLEFKNTPEERAYREAKARFNPWWHRERAEEHVENEQLFAAVFHQAWLLKHDLENEPLANEFKNTYSKLQAQFKEEGRDLEAILPPVVKDAIKLLPKTQSEDSAEEKKSKNEN